MPETGVFPVFNNVFKIGKAGKTSAAADMVAIKDMESFSVSMDNNIEEWTPMDQEGWVRRLQTGKGFSITLTGKRNVGDPGNDYVAGLAWKTGQETETKFQWEFPSGLNVEFDCVVNVTTPGGGASTDVEALEFEVMSNGKPAVTEPSQGGEGA